MAEGLNLEQYKFLYHIYDKRGLYNIRMHDFQVEQSVPYGFTVACNFWDYKSHDDLEKLWRRYLKNNGKVSFIVNRSPLSGDEIDFLFLKFQEWANIKGSLTFTNKAFYLNKGCVEVDFYVTFPSEELIAKFSDKYMEGVRNKMDKTSDDIRGMALDGRLEKMFDNFIADNNEDGLKHMASAFPERVKLEWADVTKSIEILIQKEHGIPGYKEGPGYRIILQWEDCEGVDWQLYELYLGNSTGRYERFEPIMAEDLEAPHEFRVLMDEDGMDFRVEKKVWMFRTPK